MSRQCVFFFFVACKSVHRMTWLEISNKLSEGEIPAEAQLKP